MAKNRIIYQNWLVEIGYDPKLGGPHKTDIEEISIDELFEDGFDIEQKLDNSKQIQRNEFLQNNVQNALAKLSEDEREFIIRFHFMGEKYVEIAEKTEREQYSLVGYHNQIIKKLKKYLKQFVKDEFQVSLQEKSTCPICLSPYKSNINSLLETRDKKSTWKHVMQSIEEKYNLQIKAPQILIGHEKYH